MDYPNSKKAKKVFLCLFVGGGGGQQQVPKALDDEDGEISEARFERRREREQSKTKNGKRKGVKDRDWILKKKEVITPYGFYSSLKAKSCHSFIANVEKKTFLETQSTLVENAGQSSKDIFSVNMVFTRNRHTCVLSVCPLGK